MKNYLIRNLNSTITRRGL